MQGCVAMSDANLVNITNSTVDLSEVEDVLEAFAAGSIALTVLIFLCCLGCCAGIIACICCATNTRPRINNSEEEEGLIDDGEDERGEDGEEPEPMSTDSWAAFNPYRQYYWTHSRPFFGRHPAHRL